MSIWYDYDPADFWTAAASATIDRNSTGMEDDRVSNDYFGSSGAVGDFNNDTYDDVAIGVPGDDTGASGAGSIHVIYGGSSGLSASNSPVDQIFEQDTTSIPGAGEVDDNFGEQVISDDFNCDGYADVAIGAPNEDIGSETSAGAVWVIYGSSTGLSATNSQEWDQDTSGVLGAAEAGDECGSALAAGNFDNTSSGGNACMDLAFGCPGEDVGAVSNAGAVNVLYAPPSGFLSATDDDLWDQSVTNIEGTADTDDEFGAFLATFDGNSDGYAELMITVEEGCAIQDVAVIFGSSSGLTSTNDTLGCGGEPETLDKECSGCIGGQEFCTCDFGAYGGGDFWECMAMFSDCLIAGGDWEGTNSDPGGHDSCLYDC
jgi:hypothetical protein